MMLEIKVPLDTPREEIIKMLDREADIMGYVVVRVQGNVSLMEIIRHSDAISRPGEPLGPRWAYLYVTTSVFPKEGT